MRTMMTMKKSFSALKRGRKRKSLVLSHGATDERQVVPTGRGVARTSTETAAAVVITTEKETPRFRRYSFQYYSLSASSYCSTVLQLHYAQQVQLSNTELSTPEAAQLIKSPCY